MGTKIHIILISTVHIIEMHIPLLIFKFIENVFDKAAISTPGRKIFNKCDSVFSCTLIGN
jgi:hypothetical protein